MFETFLKFFEEQSGLANLFQIVGGGITLCLVVWRGFVRWKKTTAYSKISNLSDWLLGQKYSPSQAKNLRVAIVDDHPEDYPLETLRLLGYSITDIHALSLADIPTLLSYDCILLDINGVLKEDTKRGGLEILKRLKVSGGPYIVAVSSRGFDITISEFFMLADHRLKKPIPPADLEGIIEQAFITKYSAADAAKRIDKELFENISAERPKKSMLKTVIDYLEAGTNKDVLLQRLATILPNTHRRTLVERDFEIIRIALKQKS